MQIGLIDYNLNNAHANRYSQLLPEQGGADVKIGAVWAAEEGSSHEWASQRNLQWHASPEAVARNSDAVMLLAPDNPELHLPLAQRIFPHVKLVYIDKTFAPSVKEAEAIFSLADTCGTRIFSTSAMRYAPALVNYLQNGAPQEAKDVEVGAPGKWSGYGVHAVEPAITLFGVSIKRLRASGSQGITRVELEWQDGRTGLLTLNSLAPTGYEMQISETGNFIRLDLNDRGFYAGLARTVLQFFHTGVPPVPPNETLMVIKVLEYAHKSLETGNWVSLG